MAGMFGFHTGREAIRVKVTKLEGHLQPEFRKFSVDPQITSFEVLQSILARAFDVVSDFTISYLTKDDQGVDTYIALLSDWDLDAAFLGASDPHLQLKVELKSFEEGLEEWDIITPVDIGAQISQNIITHINGKQQSIKGTILNQMEKTFTLMQKAFGLNENTDNLVNIKPLKPPMSDSEFHNFLDSEGKVAQPKELRLSIYQGGIEPSLRKVVWKHILNVYPEGMNGKERMDYMRRKSLDYYRLRSQWQDNVKENEVCDEMQYVTNMVRKDVLRTDRTHKFYAGSDDNKNVVSLFNLLTTYALNHPSVSYCQGMSDLASPILVTMKDEAHAYICFCALMNRLKPNFLLDGKAMTLKFQHLSEVLQFYDPVFYNYLKHHQADDLLFCYRWLLLELKREFAFDDALKMLEVLWSSLPPNPPSLELELFEEEFSLEMPQSPSLVSKENPYIKVRALRKQSSLASLSNSCKQGSTSSNGNVGKGCHIQNSSKKDLVKPRHRRCSVDCEESSCHSDSQEYFPLSTAATRELKVELESLNCNLTASPNKYFKALIQGENTAPNSPISFDGSSSVTDTTDGTSGPVFDLDDDRPVLGGCIFQNQYDSRSLAERKRATMTPDELCDIEYDDPDDVVQDRSDFCCSGEIFENEVNCDSKLMHLKSVIPILLVREKNRMLDKRTSETSESSADSLPGSPGAGGSSDVNIHNKQNPNSEGYASAETTSISSKEISQEVSQCNNGLGDDRFLDSGVIPNTMTNSCEEVSENCDLNGDRGNRRYLPPPHEFAGGNPFMMFLCLTLLLQHRDFIMKNNMDYNELAIHFDKMIRKHNVQRVLHQARAFFVEYLKCGFWESTEGSESFPNLQL